MPPPMGPVTTLRRALRSTSWSDNFNRQRSSMPFVRRAAQRLAMVGLTVTLFVLMAAAPVRPAEREGHATSQLGTRNVILVMMDGLRWQELFGGVQKEYIGPLGG